MTTTENIATFEQHIRAQADQQIAAVHTLVEARAKMLDAREAFKRQDEENVSKFKSALKAAKDAGITDKTLTNIGAGDPTSRRGASARSTASRSRGGKRAGKRGAADATANAPEPTENANA